MFKTKSKYRKEGGEQKDSGANLNIVRTEKQMMASCKNSKKLKRHSFFS